MRCPFCNDAMLTVQVKLDCCHGRQWQPHAKILAKIRPRKLPPICHGGGGGDLITILASDIEMNRAWVIVGTAWWENTLICKTMVERRFN